MVTWDHGVAWIDKAYTAAAYRGIVAQVTAIAIDYARGKGNYAVHHDPSGDGRIQVTRDGIGAVLGAGNVVIGYSVVKAVDQEADDASRRANLKPIAQRRASGMGGPSRHGPSSFSELIMQLREGGYEVEHGGSHWAVRDGSGARVYTMPVSSSDHRALTNCITDLRRLTGLDLRR